MSNRNYSIHIGINDYSAYQADDRDNLAGAVNDARRWRKFTRETIGIPDSQVKILTDGDALVAHVSGAVQRDRVGARGFVGEERAAIGRGRL